MYQDGQEEGKGKAVGAHAHISVVGPKEQGNEHDNIEARQRPDALWRPACIQFFSTCFCDMLLPQVRMTWCHHSILQLSDSAWGHLQFWAGRVAAFCAAQYAAATLDM